jgi:hypothetical protein
VERHPSELVAERQHDLEAQRQDICLSAKWDELPTRMAMLLQPPMGYQYHRSRAMECRHQRHTVTKHLTDPLIQHHRDPQVWRIVQHQFHNTAQLQAGEARDGNQYGFHLSTVQPDVCNYCIA